MSATEQQESGIVKVEAENVTLKTTSPLPNNRPITSTGLDVTSIMHIAGSDRPIVSSHMQITEYIGNRPVVSTNLKVSQLYSVMGTRPIASNEIDDSYTLMGYID